MESVIHSFFSEYAGLDSLTNAALIICRQDGVPLYSYKDFSSQWNDSTVGALVGGMWLAAETLTQFIPLSDDEKDGEFRFSFETSSRGIFIIKLDGDFPPLYLSFIYFDLMNPARIKSRLRSLISKLTHYIEENLQANVTSDDVFLFDEISENEMDNLFAGVMDN